MKECFELARQAEGKTSPNPLVGCIVLNKNGEIILGDEISPDGCRLWDSETLDMLDKELFRKGKDNEVMDAYVEVYNRIIPDDEKIEL